MLIDVLMVSSIKLDLFGIRRQFIMFSILPQKSLYTLMGKFQTVDVDELYIFYSNLYKKAKLFWLSENLHTLFTILVLKDAFSEVKTKIKI